MYQELEMWRKENAGHADALRREEKLVYYNAALCD